MPRVSLATFLFCGFAADLFHGAKLGSSFFVSVVADVWVATGLLRFAATSLACLVWGIDRGKAQQGSLGCSFDGAFCGDLLGRHWSADGAYLDLVLAALFSGGVGYGRGLRIPICWVWDPGLIVELLGYGGYGGEVASPVFSSGRSNLVVREVWLMGFWVFDLGLVGLLIYGL